MSPVDIQFKSKQGENGPSQTETWTAFKGTPGHQNGDHAGENWAPWSEGWNRIVLLHVV